MNRGVTALLALTAIMFVLLVIMWLW